MHHTFGIFLVKRPNIEGVGSVDFASRRDKWWWILLLINNIPIYAYEEWMLFKFFGTIASAAKSFVYVSL